MIISLRISSYISQIWVRLGKYMQLIIKNRDRIVFQGEVDNVTSYNKKGTFNILMDHANFISVIEKKLIYRQKGSTQEILVDNALLKVRENKVIVYLGIK